MSHVPLSTDSSETLKKAREWLDTCKKEHKKCQAAKSQKLFYPSRLLDLHAECGSGVKLIDTRETDQRLLSEYACLSHCWGDVEAKCMTTDANLERNKLGVPWEEIPRTFQDAIEFTRSLGIRYLWIDNLCIIQRNEADWASEAALMCHVYTHSTITLAATKAPNSHGGLFSSRSPEYDSSSMPVSLPNGGGTLTVFARREMPHFPTSEAGPDRPLLSRAWVLQERILSPRVLHFCKTELLWECLSGDTCQCVSPAFSTGCQKTSWSTALSGDKEAAAPEEWLDIVQEYSKLYLKFRKDKLPALSGAAQRTAMFRNGDTYLAGLWKSGLPHGLAWWALGDAAQKKRPEGDEWAAPTWSWACIDAPVRFFWWMEAPNQPVAVTKKAEIEYYSADKAGRIRSGSITISAPAVEATLAYTGSESVTEKRGRNKIQSIILSIPLQT
ncbi:hypothetical protein AAE478_004944 [Parahypoxylon ruwenzoriense]